MNIFIIVFIIFYIAIPIPAFCFDFNEFSKFLSPPPSENNIYYILDEVEYQKGKKIRESKRGKDAVLDADFSTIAYRFSESYGLNISKTSTPDTYSLIKYICDNLYKDVIKKVKKIYKRKRPYVLHNEYTCYKNDENRYRNDGSYPSGHSASAWIIALVLSEIAPERTGEIMMHGFDVGQSRVICGYHWQSDVDIARFLASAYFSTLHNDEIFKLKLKSAKLERIRMMR